MQLIGRCTFVQEFRSQLTQVNVRLTNLEAAAEMNKEELKQKTDTAFTAVQEKVETLRSETAQLALTMGRNITQIKEELSDVKQNADTNFAAVGVNLATIKGELVGIKQRTNTSFAAVQDALGDLEAEQQKVGEGLETLRSETSQLALTVGRNITQIKEELSDVKQNADTNFAAVGVNLATIKGELVGIKQRTNTSFAAVQDALGDLETEQQKVGEGLETLRSETAQLTLTVGRNITQIKEELSDGFATINIGNVEMRQLEIKKEIEEIRNETRRPDRIVLSYPYIPISCSEIFEINANSPSSYYQLRAPNGTITTEYCFASSCSEKAERDPSSPPGYYQLMAPNGTITTEYCPMECKKCLAIKSTGGWRRVAYLNMTDPTHQCPSDFIPFTEPRRCSSKTNFGCSSVTYPVHGIQYQRVCGRVIAIQKGNPTAFEGAMSINTNYVQGVSLTHGSQLNRHHIWTFAAALDEQHANAFSCPCSDTRRHFTGRVPDFVGDDYFCDSGTRVWSLRGGAGWNEVYTEDPLWDGSGCGPTSSCCTFNSPPWFCKELPQPTTDDIELRLCRTFFSIRDTQIKLIELYIQ